MADNKYDVPKNTGAYVALVVSVVMLGVNWPFMKLGLAYFSPFWMVSLRFCLSAPVVALLVVVLKRRLPVFNRLDLRVIIGVALMQFVTQMGLVTLSLKWIPAGTASILIYTTPLWLVLLDLLVFRARIEKHRLAITVASAFGCAIVVFSSSQAMPVVPLFMVLLASVFWSLSMRLIATHRWSGDVPDAVFWQFLLAGLVTLPLAWFMDGSLAPEALSLPGLLLLLFVGPFATGLGFGLMIVAGRSLPVARVSLVSTAAPLIGFLSSALILNEAITVWVAFGGAVILAALVAGSFESVRRGAKG